MNSIRLLSGRVPVTDLANLTADRYQFLSVTQAEPNLGNGYSSTDVLTLGTNGVRVWANALSVASVSASGNITANIINANTLNISSATGNILAGNISATGNIKGGNLNTGGQISATGNINTSGYFIGTFAGNIAGNLTVPGSNTQVLFNNAGNAGAAAGLIIRFTCGS
jgi:hypothetical protein